MSKVSALFLVVLALVLFGTACGVQEANDDGDECVTNCPDPEPDAGTVEDGGHPHPKPDASVEEDAGTDEDGGVTPDAGNDAGVDPEPDAGSDAGTDTVVPPVDVKPAPASVLGCTLLLHNTYVKGSEYAEVRGDTAAGIWSWDNGPKLYDANADHLFSIALEPNVVDGQALRFTYFDREGPGQLYEFAPADYGNPDHLSQISSEGRKPIYCNWWDATGGRVIANSAIEDRHPADGKPDNPGCILQYTVHLVSGTCSLEPSGNMVAYKK